MYNLSAATVQFQRRNVQPLRLRVFNGNDIFIIIDDALTE